MASIATGSGAAGAANVAALAAALRQEAGVFQRSPPEARLQIQVLRLLAAGQPITARMLEPLATSLGFTLAAAQAVLDGACECNAAGDIVGITGLSLNEWPHHFTVAGRRLATWCAFDTLFLPPLLQQQATVEAADPLTHTRVRLPIRPDRLAHYTPAGTVISLHVPDAPLPEHAAAAQIWSMFCGYSHYFTSAHSAAQWRAAHHPETIILAVEEGYAVARQYLAATLLSI